MAMTFFSEPASSTPVTSLELYMRNVGEDKACCTSSARARSSEATTAAVGSPRAVSRANVGPDSTAKARSPSPNSRRRHLGHALQGVVLDPLRAADDRHFPPQMGAQLRQYAAVVMARHDHEQHIAESGRLGQRARNVTDASMSRRSEGRSGCGACPLDLRGHVRVMRPEHDLVAAAGRHSRHRRPERSGADDQIFMALSPLVLPSASRSLREPRDVGVVFEDDGQGDHGAEDDRPERRVDEEAERNSGIDAALSIEASETKRVARMTMKNTSTPPATAIGLSARNAPVAVAIPLPPWNRSQTGYMCASTAMSPASAIHSDME